jgi:hypothetical protein
VKLTRNIVTLIVALSITWQSIVPCGCELCSHDSAHVTSHDTDSAGSQEGCSHSSHDDSSHSHSLDGRRIHKSRGLSTHDPDSQHSFCHRFIGTATSNSSGADFVLTFDIATHRGSGSFQVLCDVKRMDLLKSREVTVMKIDPGAVLRLQV